MIDMEYSLFFRVMTLVFCFPFDCSVSSLMTTTEAIIVESPKEEKAAPAMGGGGMGGMDF
jgi:hypothetical protein